MRDGARVVLHVVPRLAHPRDEEHLVIHREPEQHGEQEDRDPAFDLIDLVQPREAVAEAPAEEDDEHPVARRDREQVEDHGFQREQQRAERTHQQQVGQHEHRQHEPGEGAVGDVEEVHALRRTAAGKHGDAVGEAGGRDDLLAEAVDEALGALCSVVAAAGHHHLRVAAALVDEAAGRQEEDLRDLRVLPQLVLEARDRSDVLL